jgi:PPOX class probable F420-dependent enzyme
VRLEANEARRRFAAVPVARLATVRDGAPRIVPIVFAVAGDVVYTAVDHKPKSTRALRRLDDVARHPSVAVLADHYADDWTQLWWVRADGVARVLDTDEGIGLLAAKYPQYERARPAGPVVRIDVTRWSGWAAG